MELSEILKGTEYSLTQFDAATITSLDERIVFEYPIYFGREAKRADIVIRNKEDFNVAYIIVEVKKPKAKDGREQLKSYTHSTGANMAVWSNGTAITYHQRKNSNYFEDIPDIPKNSETQEVR